ncbi:MAG TPA: ATP-grasp domain-containing protein [Burkholderiales bacterium]|nr:ATP-grasp domain-containing protein [Burkholderiales bacterium]
MPVSPDPRPYLVVSASGRALARSAARRGIRVVVLDLFNDVDTRALALASRACAGRRGRFHRAFLLQAARELAPTGGYAGLVVGSGLEGRPALLHALSRQCALLGNSPETVVRVKDPEFFFPLLDRLAIPHPEVRMTAPRNPQGWLAKRVGGAGGAHVRQAHLGWPRKERRYFQRFQAGRVMSALFLADGKRACLVGVNEQWTAELTRAARFAYGGAVTADDVAEPVRTAASNAAARLTDTLGLRGLNGLDFVLAGDAPRVLELNARPTATLDLYDDAIPGGLFAQHLSACAGRLGVGIVPRDSARAHAIVYAACPWRVPLAFDWPEWVTDIPAGGSLIAAGAPVCTVHAQGESMRATREVVMARREAMQSRFWEKPA